MLDMDKQINFAKMGKWAGWTVAGIMAFGFLMSIFQTVELGYTKVYQNTFTGTKAVFHGPDWFISPPIIGKEREYKDDTTVAFSADPADL